MKYDISNDIIAVSKIINLTFSQLSNYLGVARSTITRIVNGESYPSDLFLESFYSFVYSNSIRDISLNELKVRYAKEKHQDILFHGIKRAIDGEIDLKHSRSEVDVGVGFYLGESYEQSSSYIFPYRDSSIYIFAIHNFQNLKIVEFDISLEWMLMVSYYRGQLDEYKDSQIIIDIIKKVNEADVIIAPIADNDMYEIMTRFARGDITDLQASLSLSASNLGKQYVLKTEKAIECVEMVERLYLCKQERNDIEIRRKEKAMVSKKTAKELIESLRRKGQYIEEILK